MSGAVAVVWGDRLAGYDFGPSHPLRPQRVQLTMALARELGLLEAVRLVEPAPGDAADLARVHDAAYIAAVQRASEDGRPQPAFGLGPGDTPAFTGMHQAASAVCGATVTAAATVLEGGALHAFSPAGGLHHAMAGRGAGFCVYNDPAVAIAWLRAQGVGRIAYVDVDVHHGDGVQALFYDEPDVLTISLHESGRYLFPGTGFVEEIGTAAARGSSVNVPLPPYTSDGPYLEAFDAIVPPLVHAFRPDVLVSQLGCDTHATDPLAHLGLTLAAYEALAARLHNLAHEAAGGRWLATGGGGYQWATVVPRAWCAYLAEMVDVPLPRVLPAAYSDDVRARFGVDLPRAMADPPSLPGTAEAEARVQAEVALVVASVRRAVFELNGLPAS